MNAATDHFDEYATAARRIRTPAVLAGAWTAVLALACSLLLPAAAGAQTPGPRDQAKRIHDRLTGTPPSVAMLDAMTMLVQQGNSVGAGLLAIDGCQAGTPGCRATVVANGNFYTVVLKNFAMPWTNRDQAVHAPLNDYVATVIGMVRDEVPFNQVLSADILYTGNAPGLPGYAPNNNAHYEELESRGLNLRDVLQRQMQSAVTGLPAEATAGVLTTRAAARAFFVAGTNRAMFRYTLMAHMCRDLEQTMDATRATDRIRQDVSRSPGGDSRLFLGNCAGCHAGMDPMTQAFAYYHYDFPDGGDEATGRIVYTRGTVQPKYFNNEDTFRPGYRTPDDQWENRWRHGPNALLGWDPQRPGRGAGAKSLGEELGNSEAFATCQVGKVFENVCLRAPSDAEDRGEISRIVGVFRSRNFSLKRVFAETAAYCRGE